MKIKKLSQPRQLAVQQQTRRVKIKTHLRQILTCALSIILALGIISAVTGGGAVSLIAGHGLTAYAADIASDKPSTSTYASKADLGGDTFAPGTGAIGKIRFGKFAGSDIIWYLLGTDSGVSGENTALFATDNIATGWFSMNDSTAKNPGSDYGIYPAGTSVETVYGGHYGASDLRGKLKSLARDTSYFTAEQQAMMNATTVTTWDVKNACDYTTTDKLYALTTDGYGRTVIKAGTNNDKELSKAAYFSGGIWFWLRTPVSDLSTEAKNAKYAFEVLQTNSSCCVRTLVYDAGGGVRPASNLNLTNILFSSAAEAASSEAETGEIIATASNSAVMDLRLDGTNKNIGTAIYSSHDNTIAVTKGSTDADVALVVQGKNGSTDWYYSKQINGAETISNSDIVSALTGISIGADDIDLSNCRIWMETADDDMIYAVEALPKSYTISTSAVNGAITPSGETQAYEDRDLTITYQPNDGYALESISVDDADVSIEDKQTSYTFRDITEEHSLSVVFKPIVYNITYNGLEDATITDNPSSYTVESDTITLNNPTKTGYAFSGWSTDGAATPAKDVKIDQGSMGDKAFTANWVIYTYTVTFNEGCKTTKVPVDYAHRVGRPDNPSRDGYRFGGWYTDWTCTRAWDFDNDIVTSDVTIYAKWIKTRQNSSASDASNSSNSEAGVSEGSDSTVTGDEADASGLLALLTLAGAGAVGTAHVRRRQN